MTVSSIIVRFPFPLSPIKSSQITVTFEMKIIDVIKICLQKQGHPEFNPHDYTIVINPLSFALLPFLSIGDYKNAFFEIDECSFSLVPKMLFSFRVNILTVQIATYADKNQTFESLIYQIKVASTLFSNQETDNFDKVIPSKSNDGFNGITAESSQEETADNNDSPSKLKNIFFKNLTPKIKSKNRNAEANGSVNYYSLTHEIDTSKCKQSPIDLDYIYNLSELNVYFNGQSYPLNTVLNDLIVRNHYQTVILTLKREKKTSIGKWSTNDIVPVFKGTIQDALRRNKSNSPIPFFIEKLFELIESNKSVVGIYRKSGDQGIINQIVSKINTTLDENELSQFLSEQHAHELSGVLKLYLRQLSEALVPDFLSSAFRSVLVDENSTTGAPQNSGMAELSNLQPGHSSEQNEVPRTIHRSATSQSKLPPLIPLDPKEISNLTTPNNNSIQLIKLHSLLRALPKENFLLFKALCKHLEVIEQASETNQMNYKNISICISTNIVRVSQGLSSIKETQESQSVCQLIFENWRSLFEGPSQIKAVRITPQIETDLILPEPIKVIKLAIIPNISVLSSRTYFRPDHKIIEMQSNSSVAAQVSKKLKEIEDQINDLTQQQLTIGSAKPAQAKLRYLLRQLDSI